jgi:GNAT superfamily N-acetyltransferase
MSETSLGDNNNNDSEEMKRKIIIRTNREVQVPIEALNDLRRAAFEQWEKESLYFSMSSDEHFGQYLRDKVVFVAHDEATGELLGMHTLKLNKRKGRADGANLAVSSKAKREGIASRMLEAEAQRLCKNGYRYIVENTAIPATWSVQWHLKNGYYIVGYSRSEKNKYASYVFRKQIAPSLLWSPPLAPLTAKLLYCLSWLATNICKSKSGKLNWLGRMAKDVRRLMSDG